MKGTIDQYLYFYPMGGICDILKMIHYLLTYCRKYKRLLIVSSLDHYEISMEDYFDISNEWIVTDTSSITSILQGGDTSCTIHPKQISPDILLSLLDVGKGRDKDESIRNKFHLVGRHDYFYKPTSTCLSYLPDICSAKVLFLMNHGRSGSWIGAYSILRSMYLIHPDIHSYIRSSIMRIGEDYACIHIRHTDRKTNYVSFLNKHIEWLKNTEVLYVCTDSKEVLQAVRRIVPHAMNFTSYPEGSYHNLHRSNIDAFLKMQDLIFDMYVCMHASSFICNGVGGFSHLIQYCRRDLYSLIKRD